MPIDIVTEKSRDTLKSLPIILMIPDKTPLIARRQDHGASKVYNSDTTYPKIMSNHLPERSPKYLIVVPLNYLLRKLHLSDYPSHEDKRESEHYYEDD